jgi:hypothetical protein
LVGNSSTIEVNDRAKLAKTDTVDLGKLLLMWEISTMLQPMLIGKKAQMFWQKRKGGC